MPNRETIQPPPELTVMLQDLADRYMCTQRETPDVIERRSAEVKKQALDILTSYGETHYSREDSDLCNLYGLFHYKATPPVKVIIEEKEIPLELVEVLRYDHVTEAHVLDTIAVRAGEWDIFRIEKHEGKIYRRQDQASQTETPVTLREINTLSKILVFIDSSLSNIWEWILEPLSEFP